MMYLNFNIAAYLTITLWLIGMIFISIDQKLKPGRLLGNIFISMGNLIIITFVILLWINIERPPLRTLGETRLWYAIFIPIIGLFAFLKWKYKWFLYYSYGLAILFLVLNISSPENFDKTLMPALQSPWFVPHVIVYMLAYALLGVSSAVSAWGLYQNKTNKFKIDLLNKADNLVYMGFSLLSLGLIFGALWAKIAWGHYWTWDPKETWALLTWLSYLLYIHFRYNHKNKIVIALWLLAISFVFLMICWLGINYLSVGSNSVHTYSYVIFLCSIKTKR